MPLRCSRLTDAENQCRAATVSLERLLTTTDAIHASSEKIAKIIRTIDEISFQTNMVALNAAVEAVGAGEAGAGFAIVADEVRNLAQRCAQAARDTSSLIEESIGNASSGRAAAAEMEAVLARIARAAIAARELVDGVTAGSSEQARGIDLMANSLQEMQQVTQSTATTAEEDAAAAQRLSQQSCCLTTVVNRLGVLAGQVADR